MVFSLALTGDQPSSVMVMAQFDSEIGTRAEAAWDAAAGSWTAALWELGGVPAWVRLGFHWRVTYADGSVIDSEPHAAEYADPSRQWFRADSADMTIVWYGLSEDDPDRLARAVLSAVAAGRPALQQGFGADLSYRPLTIIYPTRAAAAEIYSSGTSTRGFASDDLGISLLAAPGGAGVEAEIGWLTFSVVHEMVHLYQFDVVGGIVSPLWWAEGQANWFSRGGTVYDERLRNLIVLQDLPPLTEEVSLDVKQADGRPDLGYDMGASFINWLLANYGGIETHARLTGQLIQGQGVYEAIESVTGRTFFDLQNEWRAYLGLPPFALADLDPAAALEPLIDPRFAVGDVLTLPGTPAIVPLMADPAPRALISGQCFGGMQATVRRTGSRDGVDYVELDCMGLVGWVTAEQLAGVETSS
jgi:hypothetical protein